MESVITNVCADWKFWILLELIMDKLDRVFKFYIRYDINDILWYVWYFCYSPKKYRFTLLTVWIKYFWLKYQVYHRKRERNDIGIFRS